MSIVKSIYVEAKKSKNYQTYTVGMTVEVQGGDLQENALVRKYQAECRKLVQEQIKIDEGGD